MPSTLRREGYIIFDNTNSPGIDEATARALNLKGPIVGEGATYESATKTCSHCRAVVILNPNRSRERNYCSGCDDYICDNCATTLHLTKICTPFKKVIDRAVDNIEHGLTPEGLIKGVATNG